MTDATGLKVDLVDDRLMISIDVDTLCGAVEYGLNERRGIRGRVSDKAAFVRELMQQLQVDDEDGSTCVHHMFDKAAEDMLENGAEGWEDEGDDE